MDARKSPARGLRCLLTWSAAVLGMWEAEWGFPHVSGLDTIVAGLSWHQVTSPSPLSKGLHWEGRHLSRHLGQPCGCWGVPCAILSARGAPCREHCRVPARPAGVLPARPAPAPACLLLRLPGRLPLRELLPVLPGVWRCQRVGAAGSTRASPAGPQQGSHLPLLMVPTSKPSPVPPTSTTPHLWQLQDAVKHFST